MYKNTSFASVPSDRVTLVVGRYVYVLAYGIISKLLQQKVGSKSYRHIPSPQLCLLLLYKLGRLSESLQISDQTCALHWGLPILYNIKNKLMLHLDDISSALTCRGWS